MDATVFTDFSLTVEPSPHPSSEAVAAYVDGRSTGAELVELEQHLAECTTCRRELVEVSELLASTGERQRRTWAAAAASVLAAAGVAGVLLVVSGPDRARPTDEPRMRSLAADTEELAQVRAVAPREGALMAADGLRFSWRSLESATLFRVTLTDRNGDVVWKGQTADTSLQLPTGSGLRRGTAYFWYVDALLPDGNSLTSGIRTFRTSP